MYERYDNENEHLSLTETYEHEVIEDATRFYHEHFTMDDDYDEKFEVTTFEQAKDFWQANGYDIRKNFQEQQGQCPICKSKNITYLGSEIQNPYLFYRGICDKCKTTFDEYYELVFAGMENVEKES